MPFTHVYSTYKNKALDLNEYCIKNPPATFIMKVDSMDYPSRFFSDGDMLVVDRSINPKNNGWVIVSIDGSLSLKKVLFSLGKMYILPENPMHKPIPCSDIETFSVWGVVTYMFRQVV